MINDVCRLCKDIIDMPQSTVCKQCYKWTRKCNLKEFLPKAILFTKQALWEAGLCEEKEAEKELKKSYKILFNVNEKLFGKIKEKGE